MGSFSKSLNFTSTNCSEQYHGNQIVQMIFITIGRKGSQSAPTRADPNLSDWSKCVYNHFSLQASA